MLSQAKSTVKKLLNVYRAGIKDPTKAVEMLDGLRASAMATALNAAWTMPKACIFVEADLPEDKAETSRRLVLNRLGLHAATAVQTAAAMSQFKTWLGMSLLVAGTQAGQVAVAADNLGIMAGVAVAVGASSSLAALYLGLKNLLGFAGVDHQSVLGVLPRIHSDVLTETEKSDTESFATRCLFRLRRFAGIPADLDDVYRTLNYDENGHSIDGQIVKADVTVSYLSRLYILTFAGLVGAAGTLAGLAGLLPLLAGAAGSAIGIGLASAAGLALTMALFSPALSALGGGQAAIRAKIAHAANEESPVRAMIEQVGQSVLLEAEKARIEQQRNAAADKTPFIRLGTSTGLLAQRRDPYAPSKAGMPFGYSVADASMHTILLGRTGAGKTIFLRALLNQWKLAGAGGLVVLDGKGALPAELTKYPGFRVINPETAPDYNPIAGLNADDVAATIVGIFGGESDDPKWDQMAEILLSSAGVVLETLVQWDKEQVKISGAERTWRWSLADLYRVALFHGAVKEIPEAIASRLSFFEQQAWNYVLKEHPSIADKTRSGIDANLRTWLRSLTNHRALSGWAQNEDGPLIEDAFNGKAFGVLLPEAQFGQAGLVMSALAKKRLYRAAMRRGDAWKKTAGQTPCMLVMDECQELVTPKIDASMASMGRSLGLYMVLATQSIDGLENRLGDVEANMLLGNLTNMIALAVRTDKTREFIASRIDSAPRTTYSTTQSARIDGEASLYGEVDFGGSRLSRMTKQSNFLFEARLMTGIGGQVAAGLATLAEKTGVAGVAAQIFSQIRPAGQGTSVNVGIQPLIQADEVGLLTSTPRTALVSVERGGVPRRDVVRLDVLFEFPGAAEKEKPVSQAEQNALDFASKLADPAIKPSELGSLLDSEAEADAVVARSSDLIESVKNASAKAASETEFFA